MTDRDALVYFLHMREYAQEAVEIADGRSRSDLDDSKMFSRAMERLVELIGEAAGNVPIGVRRRFPEIRWRPIISMRNRLIHGYENVDYDVVWKTLVESVPELLAQLDVAIEQMTIDAGGVQRGGDDDPT